MGKTVENYINEIGFEKYSHIENLEGIDEDDRVLIIAQCEHQHATSDEQVKGFMQAYQEAKFLSGNTGKLSHLNKEQVLELILHWAKK